MRKSTYLRSDDRLADVVSAIQTLGTYRFYKLAPEKWSERISGDPSQATRWTLVFREHPELFRFSSNGQMVSLVLRRQKPKLFDVDTLGLVDRDERDSRDQEGQSRISRSPLSENEMQMLIGVANSMHSKALQDRQDGRWWLPLAATVVSAAMGLGGVWLGATLKADVSSASPVAASPQESD